MAARKRVFSRRDFIHSLWLAGAAAPVVASLNLRPERGRSAGRTIDPPPAECPDVTLTEQQAKTRKALQYVDASPHEDKRCENCRLFQPPEEEAVCGGCQAVPGPVHPKGYCIAWAAVTH